MQSKLSLQSRDKSGVSFTVHFEEGLLLLNFCCSFFLFFPYFHSSSVFSRLQSPALLHLCHMLKLPTCFFLFFLEVLLLHFTCSFICCFWFWGLFGLCFFAFSLCFSVFPLLLPVHLKLVRKTINLVRVLFV